MRKIAKLLGICILVAAVVWCCGIVSDRQRLSEDIIRLHVVADSNSEEDQTVKLQVRDALVESLQETMQSFSDTEDAREYLRSQLPKLERIAGQVLQDAGFQDDVTVTLTKEAFSTRDYDTFSLPAGVYESLRVTIGSGQGKNWWCVVFPSLCLPAVGENFEDTAAGAGFSDSLTDTLQRQEGYEIRFFFLDCLGWLQNWLSGV